MNIVNFLRIQEYLRTSASGKALDFTKNTSNSLNSSKMAQKGLLPFDFFEVWLRQIRGHSYRNLYQSFTCTLVFSVL